MGIRNLAYCILDVAPLESPKRLEDRGNGHERKDGKPVLQSWHRLAVSSKPKVVDEDVSSVKESFDPKTMSGVAYSLLRHRLLAMNPDIILIERQRFRSMGSKHILEWTIRVNMFESIIYATLHTLKAEGLWKGAVIPILPGKVGTFWIGDENEFAKEEEKKGKEGTKKVRTSKNAKVRNKGAKIDLVKEWCESGEVVSWENGQVEDMVGRYIEKWDAKPGRTKMKGDSVKDDGDSADEKKMGKLDDLADCLLQGVAWLEWEKNKRLISEKGYEALLGSE